MRAAAEQGWGKGMRIALVAVAAMLVTGAARAESVPEQLDRAKEYYQQGDIAGALSELEFASQAMNLQTAASAELARIGANEAMAELFDQVDFVIAATNPDIAFPAHLSLNTRVGEVSVGPENNGALTIPANIVGNPAVSIPAGTFEGLPVGMQVIAPHHADALLLDLALVVERERPWPLVAPGSQWTVHVKLENRSYVRRLLVWGGTALKGNLDGGHWQPPGLPLGPPDQTVAGCTVPPVITLEPRQPSEWEIVYRVVPSDPRTKTSGGVPGTGGTRAQVGGA